MTALYQRSVDDARGHLFMEVPPWLGHTINMELHARIVAAYNQLGINQAEAARRCGMSPQRFGNYVKGKRTPDLTALLAIAQALETTPDELLGVSEPGDDDLLDILGKLLELEGLDHHRARTIATAAAEARRLLQALPGDGDPGDRRRIAAHAVWNIRQTQ